MAGDAGATDARRRPGTLPANRRHGPDLQAGGRLQLAERRRFTLRNLTSGEVTTTTDPGRALITGKWKDVGRFRGPILRGLAGRAPYFHNGSAKDLTAAVEFYDVRFGLGLSAQDKADLVAFLAAL